MTRTNEDKLDLLADLIEPMGAILSDRDWMRLWDAKEYAAAIKSAIKRHKQEIIQILARVDNQQPQDYRIDGVALFFRLAAMLNRPDMDLKDLFTSRAQSAAAASSGPATASTGDAAS